MNSQKQFTTESDLACWLDEFQRENHRPPSILHIGNIANNAYNNAKILNDAGFDCDVIVYDYYHNMACPEWEDADFEGDLRDSFFPAWERVNLNGFQRPRWFAQGRLKTCIRYLKARRTANHRADLRWMQLSVERTIYCAFFRLPFTRDLWAKIKRCLKLLRDRRNRFFRSLSQRWKSLKDFYDRFRTKEIQIDDSPVELFSRAFPNRADQLSRDDFAGYQRVLKIWRELFDCYDLIIGYSTDPILPLLTKKPFFAFEHGTLREIPFQKTATGRLTALAYHHAEHVFVTNADCLDNAHQLADDRVTFINHPFDDRRGLQASGDPKLRAELKRELDAEFLFFFPTRHDWVPGSRYADKGNDIFLRAFARLRADGIKVGMICCEWGNDANESRRLLREQQVDQHVKWVQPMGMVRFERMAQTCDLVIDQFKLGAFGGVLFKSLAACVPCCTYLDQREMENRFGVCPPVINVRNEDEIVSRLTEVVEQRDSLETLKKLSRDWIDKHHSSGEIVEKQMRVFHRFLASRNSQEANRTVRVDQHHGTTRSGRKSETCVGK